MPLIGENIDAYCLKCKLLLAHIVVAKVGGIVNKVKCKTCGAEHKYRLEKPAAKKPTAGKSNAPKATKETTSKKALTDKIKNNDAPRQWEIKKCALDQSVVIKDYSIHKKYCIKDVINHSVFGLGFVERIVTDKSMDVLFCDSVKLMAMDIA
ncbi:MAG: hypothetical protein ABFD50_09420 [Smithella sp.]